MARNPSNGNGGGNGGMNGGGGNAQRKGPPVPLTLLDQGGGMEDDEEETYIVVGEAGEDVAFEVCEDLEIALGVRDAMLEDGFAVKLYQAVEIEVVTDDESPAPGRPLGPGGFAA